LEQVSNETRTKPLKTPLPKPHNKTHCNNVTNKIKCLPRLQDYPETSPAPPPDPSGNRCHAERSEASLEASALSPETSQDPSGQPLQSQNKRHTFLVRRKIKPLYSVGQWSSVRRSPCNAHDKTRATGFQALKNKPRFFGYFFINGKSNK